MNSNQETKEVMRIIKDTTGNPEERERQLEKFYRDHAICPGVICKCDNPKTVICPRHGPIK